MVLIQKAIQGNEYERTMVGDIADIRRYRFVDIPFLDYVEMVFPLAKQLRKRSGGYAG